MKRNYDSYQEAWLGWRWWTDRGYRAEIVENDYRHAAWPFTVIITKR